MTDEAAFEEQIKRYRQMTGEQRLKIALDMHEAWCNTVRQEIRRQHPHADAAEVERLLHQRIEMERDIKPVRI